MYDVLTSGCSVVLNKLLLCISGWLVVAGGVGVLTLVLHLLVSV
jgi:hypothetical protein